MNIGFFPSLLSFLAKFLGREPRNGNPFFKLTKYKLLKQRGFSNPHPQERTDSPTSVQRLACEFDCFSCRVLRARSLGVVLFEARPSDRLKRFASRPRRGGRTFGVRRGKGRSIVSSVDVFVLVSLLFGVSNLLPHGFKPGSLTVEVELISGVWKIERTQFQPSLIGACSIASYQNSPSQASRPASTQARKQGSKEARKQGSKEARKQGSKEARKQGSKEARKQGSKEARKQASTRPRPNPTRSQSSKPLPCARQPLNNAVWWCGMACDTSLVERYLHIRHPSTGQLSNGSSSLQARKAPWHFQRHGSTVGPVWGRACFSSRISET